MTKTAEDRLRAIDPAAGIDAEPDEQLLALIRREQRPIAVAPHRPVRWRVTVAAGMAIAATVVLLGLTRGSEQTALPDFAARAYAATDDGPAILYSRVRSEHTVEPAGGRSRTVRHTQEQWLRGDEARTVTRGEGETPWTTSTTLGADGVMRVVQGDGQRRAIRPGEGAEARGLLEDARKGFLESFRKRYERGTLTPAGETTFAGRPVRRYVVRGVDGPDVEEYYFDAADGEPLGSLIRYRSRVATQNPDGPASSIGVVTTVTTVEALDRLDPTPANLRALRG